MTAPSPIKNLRSNNICLTGLQKQFGMPKQVKEYSRFFPDKIANTGKDPKGGYFDFIKNDLMKPLNRNLDELASNYKPYQKYEKVKLTNDYDKWALNTNKKCTSPEMIPKIQQYKEYNYPNLTKDLQKVEKYKNSYLKSDNISIRYPNLEKNLYPEISHSSTEIDHVISRNLNKAKDLNVNHNSYNDSGNNNNLYISPNLNFCKENKLGLIKNFKGNKLKFVKN